MKKKAFFENAKILNDEFNVSPLMYGSLGLEYISCEDLNSDDIDILIPSVYLNEKWNMFIDVLKQAIKVAENNKNLVTIGITPTYPETGYGYINFSSTDTEYQGAYEVVRFVEKPNIERAKQYVNSGEYLWNSGMFVWKTSSILSNIEKFLPEM